MARANQPGHCAKAALAKTAATSGQLSVWLDGRLVADIAKPTGAPGWVGWRVGNMGLDLDPKTVSLYVDDCALSRVRVGPTGVLAF
jgi:hypothetical protein